MSEFHVRWNPLFIFHCSCLWNRRKSTSFASEAAISKKKNNKKKTLESYTPRLEAIFLNIYERKKRFEEVLMKIFVRVSMCVCAQSCPTLCGLTDCRSPGSSVHGISQARILEWIAISFSRGSSQPRDQTCVSCVSCIAGGFFTNSAIWEVQ